MGMVLEVALACWLIRADMDIINQSDSSPMKWVRSWFEVIWAVNRIYTQN